MPQRGFSLVELSIVLVILGLLVGGVLGGQALIRASELRAITAEQERYLAAINSFKEKYTMLPGDVSNASSFWGACASGSCDGNGNGVITHQAPFGYSGENLKLWLHLSLAGMIEGEYAGFGASSHGGVHTIDASNTPASRFPNARWDAASPDAYNVAGTPAAGAFAFGLHFGQLWTDDPTYHLLVTHGSLKRSDAWNIDTKMDDGKANIGSLRGDSTSGCADSGADYYGLAGGGADTADCMLHFLLN